MLNAASLVSAPTTVSSIQRLYYGWPFRRECVILGLKVGVP